MASLPAKDLLTQLYEQVLGAVRPAGPQPLPPLVGFFAGTLGDPSLGTPDALIERLNTGPPDDRLITRLRLDLATWDADGNPAWGKDTPPRTVARRQRVYELLEISEALVKCFEQRMPVATDGEVLISSDFEPWYGQAMDKRHPFYWAHYAEYLAGRAWHEDDIATLDLSTRRIVERLADPHRSEAYQAKGLVVGYVQSGKTANFTGVLAKAIDVGYRLLIVLSGTTDLLRAQTQRRLDKELVGTENLLRGIDPSDVDALATVDYYGDPDWETFVSHGGLPSELGMSDIIRLTTHRGDYKSLQQGISALDFDRVDPTQPLNAPTNLHRVAARLLVVKKNKHVLEKFVRDLRKITARLSDIPALIIDDESDQASINTSNPKNWAAGQVDRTAINRLLSQLIEMLPRGQYVGYTATPFASVFVDPADSATIFPRDFILSLDRPPAYMGALDFHDLDEPAEEDRERTLADSNELAFVRAVRDDTQKSALRQAIDMFVVTGAVKLFREKAGSDPFRHHTMLVHESVLQAEHNALAADIRAIWSSAGYLGAEGVKRLRRLFEEDLAPVAAARASGEPVPRSFDEIKAHIGEVVARVGGTAGDPVLIVNGEKGGEASKEVDFEQRAVWRILVGGTKLSRGFTIEGLTVSYYRRVTKQQDTLMQMGRWFGFRRGYRDLVRLYIDRGPLAGGKGAYDLYEAFEAAVRSEELFRAELTKYAKAENGVPQITPAQVPPLVAQHIGWLKPTAANKMYNAQLAERRSPGQRLEPVGYPQDPAQLAANVRTLAPVLDAASRDGRFSYPAARGLRPFSAMYGIMLHREVVDILKRLQWLPDDHFAADLAWLESLTADQLNDWVVLLPQHVDEGPRATIAERGPLSVFRRTRRRPPLFGGISDSKHRHAAARIAGISESIGDSAADDLHAARRAALMVYPVVEVEGASEVEPHLKASEVVLAVVLYAPFETAAADGTLVRFVVKDKSRPEDIIVSAD